MEIYCYNRCSTCSKALTWLQQHKIKADIKDIKDQHPDLLTLTSWVKQSGLPLKRFFNTSGLLYKNKNLKERLVGMSEDQQLELLASDGMLVKRPVLVGKDFILVGFKEAEWAKALLAQEAV
ncbi:MAG: arsenate reductase family protein [Erysipelotrichaceae bacterium]|nr:arsenate reductase family protein [Erysipelotrichaceae bacterium]